MSDPSIAQNHDVYSDFPPLLDSDPANEAPYCLLLCHVIQDAINTLMIGGVLLKWEGDVMYWTCQLGSHVAFVHSSCVELTAIVHGWMSSCVA